MSRTPGLQAGVRDRIVCWTGSKKSHTPDRQAGVRDRIVCWAAPKILRTPGRQLGVAWVSRGVYRKLRCETNLFSESSINDPLQNRAFGKVLQRLRCRTLHLARFCNGSVAEPCVWQGSATARLQNLAFGMVLQRLRCRTLHSARFCNGASHFEMRGKDSTTVILALKVHLFRNVVPFTLSVSPCPFLLPSLVPWRCVSRVPWRCVSLVPWRCVSLVPWRCVSLVP